MKMSFHTIIAVVITDIDIVDIDCINNRETLM